MNNSINFKNINSVHFIGIGGIGMSAIADIMISQGFKVTGSDMKSSYITNKLQSKGAKIFIGHDSNNVIDSDLIVYTSAVKEDNPELVEGQKREIPTLDRAEMLGILMKGYKNSIAVSGAHGKTTSTSMLSLVLENGNLDPTILVGGQLKEIDGNVKIGHGDYLITEACEYKENFLKFNPNISIVLNIDEDHLDYFTDLNHIISSFTKFVQLLPQNGYLFINNDDYNVRKLTNHVDCNILSFGINTECDFKATNIIFDENGYPKFDVINNNEPIGSFSLSIPGKHNIYNALSAIAVSYTLGVDIETIKSTLQNFKGTSRRFDVLGEKNGIKVIDDYAHHPTEVRATLEAAKKYPHNRVWCVFQPHTYTRTKSLLLEFASSFNNADKIIITDIYAAREKDTGEVHSKDLVHLISQEGKEVIYLKSFEEIKDYLNDHTKSGDLVITMGAGNVYEIGKMFLKD